MLNLKIRRVIRRESEASVEVKLSNQDELVKHNEPCTETLKDGGHTEALCKCLWG